jgi:hypothetical protein
MQVFHILTPLISKEIPDLLCFIRYCPPPLDLSIQNKITWHLSIDTEWTETQVRLITQHVINSDFANVQLDFISCGLTVQESVYLRKLSRNDKCELPYGSKSGPNMQFFRSLNAIIHGNDLREDDAVILLETDAIPLKNNWISKLNRALSNIQTSFWIAGASYAGRSPLSSAINCHLNGNAIYGLGASGFGEFLKQWDHVLKICVSISHWIAYDIAIEWIGYYMPKQKSKLTKENIVLIEGFLNASTEMLVDISHLIRNVSADYEVSNNFVDYEGIADSVIICHSKPLSKKIPWIFDNNTLNKRLTCFQNPTARRIEALKAGVSQYLNFNDSRSFSFAIFNHIIEKQMLTSLDSQKQLYRACLTSFKSQPS